jgi:hypothetical protein
VTVGVLGGADPWGGIARACDSTWKSSECAGKCGSLVDNCGVSHACSTCVGGGDCGADNTCHYASGCTPKKCADVPANCGDVPDGCGGTLSCDSMGGGGPFGCPIAHFRTRMWCSGNPVHCIPLLVPVFQTCAGTGRPNTCGFGTDTPAVTTCEAQAKNCGYISNGVDGVLDCGQCADGSACVDNVCTAAAAPGATVRPQSAAFDPGVPAPASDPVATPQAEGACSLRSARAAAAGGVRETTGGPLAVLALSLLALRRLARRRR